MIAAATTAAATATATTAAATTTISGVLIDFDMAGLFATLFLIGILILKELITASPNTRPSIKGVVNSVDVSLASLLPIFLVIVGFKIMVAIG